MSSDPVSVLIVGAGPSGLVAANCLSDQGVRFRIVDRKAEPSDNSRAVGIQSRSLEIFEQLGLLQDFLERGRTALGADMHTPLGRVRVDLFGPGAFQSAYPHPLMLEQSVTEELLLRRLGERGHEVEWSTELLDLALEEERPEVALRSPDGGTERLRSRWLVAADGADSTIRDLLGMPFTGSTFEQRYAVADVDLLAGELDPGHINLCLHPTGFILLIPLSPKGRYRLGLNYPPRFRDRDEDPDFEAVRDHVTRVFPGTLELGAPSWFSTFRFHSRSIDSFRHGPAFFVGDAAHIHSPVGGQGMNTGIQDAHALAWRLGMVQRGELPEAALDTYHPERWPVARGVIRTTDRIFRFIDADNVLAAAIRTYLMPWIAKTIATIPPLRRRVAPLIAQVGIRYRKGLLLPDDERLAGSAPRPGDRFPYVLFRGAGSEVGTPGLLDYGCHHLLLFAGTRGALEQAGVAAKALGSELGGLLRCHVVDRSGDPVGASGYGAGAPSHREGPSSQAASGSDHWACAPGAVPGLGAHESAAFLVRPDGYVAFRTRRLQPEAIARRLRRYLQGGVSEVT